MRVTNEVLGNQIAADVHSWALAELEALRADGMVGEAAYREAVGRLYAMVSDATESARVAITSAVTEPERAARLAVLVAEESRRQAESDARIAAISAPF